MSNFTKAAQPMTKRFDRVGYMAVMLPSVALSATPRVAKADALDDSLGLFVRWLDTNRDGLVSRDELSDRLAQAKAKGGSPQSLTALQMMLRGFSMMDTNRDNKLSAGEISAGINARFANADRNNNGALTYEEASSGMPLLAKDFTKIDERAAGSITQIQARNFLAQSIKSAINLTNNP